MKKTLRSEKLLKCIMIQLVCGVLFTIVAHGQQLAFPGAEGGGRFATGGRGGTVYEVTNLNDAGAGSLRDGLSQPNRTIVFKVSGVIHLASKLSVTKNNITIAGQTAPGDGICITGYTVNIRASNIIIRHIRCRLSDVNDVEDDAMNSFSGDYQNIIIDHCSMGWSVDEAGTFYGIKNFTLQWCVLSESLYHSVHDKGNHGYGGIWGGENASFHHNLLAHHTSRNPRFCGSRFSGRPDLEVVDFRNNVLYNWGNGNSAYGGEGGHYNMVNNYYKPGPATPGNTTTSSASNKRNRILNYTSYYAGTDAAIYPDTVWGGKFYIDGNYVAGYPDVTADNWTKGVQKDSYAKAAALMAAARQSTPFSVAPVTTQTAEEAYTSVLMEAGATLPRRDAIDKRIIQEVTTGTATYEGSTYAAVTGTGITHPSGIIDTQTDVGGLPPYTTLTAPVDTDHDGMPDSWENTNGLNPGNAADGAQTAADGYTNLEHYLNTIASSEAGITVSGSLNGFVQIMGAPSSTQTYTVAGTGLSNDITITPPAGYEISPDAGGTWYTQASPLTLALNDGSISETTITVRLNGPGLGSYSGSIEHVSNGANTIGLPVSGVVSTAVTLPPGTAVVVAKDGSGDFTSVQAAVNAAPTGRTTPYIIFIRNGVYKEKINIPSNKPFIQLYGESVANVILTYDDYSGKPMPGGGTYGTSNSASVTVNAADFSAINITFENTTGDAPQALAINVNADRAAFKNCRFLGGQDTILTNGNGRQYFKNCYIDGVVDFIFGGARALFDSCIVYAKSRQDGLSGSYITAANTQNGQPYGYVFNGCTFPSNTGVTKYVLGRPWQNSTGANPLSYPKVVLLNTTMGHNQIKPEGWSVWDAGTVTSSIYYAEYKSKKFNGDLVDVSKRVSWSFQLTDAEAATYTRSALFESWDPCAVLTDLCTYTPREIAVSNFRGKKGTTTSLTWNISWPMKDIRYEVFRSTDNVSFTKINEQVAANDTTVNFSYVEAVPPPGSTYYYYVVASRTGMSSHVSQTIAISSTPTIMVTGSLSEFLQGLGLPSAVQGYKVAGENLLNDITLTPPAGYEISHNGGANWYTSASPLVLVKSGGVVASTSIVVRLNAGSTGTVSGNIVHSSGGAVSAALPVTGEVQADPLPVSETLLYWPFDSGNEDAAGSRSLGVMPSTPVFNKLYLSNGTTVATLPSYSATYGQAFCPGAAGEGLWTTASGGPGGNLNRKVYEQFTVTAKEDFSVRIDSIVLNASYYNTSSNTRFAIVFSKTGFTTGDSTDVTGGIGADGSPLLSTANGGFTTPVLLTNETTGTTRRYKFALAGANGVQISEGETLTVRLYFSCGSTSTGRYAKLKDVYIKGAAREILPPVITVDASLTDFAQTVGAPSAVQTYSVAGTDLTAGITITPPLNFEVSANGGASWSTNAAPLLLALAGNSISSTTISVRLNASAAGVFPGNINHTSGGASAVTVPVGGTTTDGITGLPEKIKDQAFFVSPNPVETSLMVHYEPTKNSGTISVYSTTGLKITSVVTEAFSGKKTIDVASLRQGLYLAEYCTQHERITVKFIKK